MSKLEKANAFCSIGTFVLTAIIVVLMVRPLPSPPQVKASDAQPTVDAPAPSRGPMSGWLMPSLLALSLISAGILHFLAARQSHKQQPAPHSQVLVAVPTSPTAVPLHSPPKLAPHRVLTNATPHELHKIWEQNTALQAKKLSEIYIGTWLTVSAPVYNVKTIKTYDNGNWRDVMNVTLRGSEGGRIFACIFEQEWEHRCSVLRKGDSVNLLGKISDFDSSIISLAECEFL